MLELSLVTNLLLVLTLLFVVGRARKKIMEEKCATFAGCIGAITSGLAIDDIERRFKTVSFFLAGLHGGKTEKDEEDVRFYLSRASMLRIFRGAALADMTEHLRLLALRAASDDDAPADEILEYISKSERGDPEPSELWGDQLAAANLASEKRVLAIYRRQISSAPIRVFG